MNSGNHHPNGKIAERQAAVDDAMVRSFDAELLSNRADKVLQVENGAEALRLTDGSGSWKLFGGMRFSLPCAVALYFHLVGLSSLAPAEEAPAATSNRTQFATSQAVYNARRHPAYQVFAQRHQPTIAVVDSKTLNFDGNLKLDIRKAGSMPAAEKNALAAGLEIPVEFLTALVQKLSAGAQLNGEELAHQFQIAVVDYKYLSERWTRYHPPAEGEPVKLKALKCLQAADLEGAWIMFINLVKPKPPTDVQIISVNKGTESH